jgi:hypothetical protein
MNYTVKSDKENVWIKKYNTLITLDQGMKIMSQRNWKLYLRRISLIRILNEI